MLKRKDLRQATPYVVRVRPDRRGVLTAVNLARVWSFKGGGGPRLLTPSRAVDLPLRNPDKIGLLGFLLPTTWPDGETVSESMREVILEEVKAAAQFTHGYFEETSELPEGPVPTGEGSWVLFRPQDVVAEYSHLPTRSNRLRALLREHPIDSVREEDDGRYSLDAADLLRLVEAALRRS